MRAPVASWAASLAQDREPVGAKYLASMRKAVLLRAAPQVIRAQDGNKAAGGDGSRVERGQHTAFHTLVVLRDG